MSDTRCVTRESAMRLAIRDRRYAIRDWLNARSEMLDRPAQPVFERDFRLPAEQLLRFGDVRLPRLRIVLDAFLGLIDHARRAARQAVDHLGEFEDRKLGRVAKVDRLVFVAEQQPVDAFDQVVYIAE